MTHTHIHDPVLEQMVALAGELVALQALAKAVQATGVHSEDLAINIAMLDHSMEQITELLASRIVGMAQIEKYRRSSFYGKESSDTT